MKIKPGTKVKINKYDSVVNPDRISKIVGKEGEYRQQYGREHLIKIDEIQYSVDREAFDILTPSEGYIDVTFVHLQHGWEVHVLGYIRTVKNPTILNKMTLRHQPAAYGELQSGKISNSFLIDLLTPMSVKAIAGKYPETLPRFDWTQKQYGALR